MRTLYFLSSVYTPVRPNKFKKISTITCLLLVVCFCFAAPVTAKKMSDKKGLKGKLSFEKKPASAVLSANIITGTTSLWINVYLVKDDNTTILADGCLAQFDEHFSKSVESEDAIKFTNINENLALLREGVSLTAERRPLIDVTDTLYLKLWKTTKRPYQFEFIPDQFNISGLTATLEDNFLKTSTRISLTGNTIIKFSIDSNRLSASAERFKVIFTTSIADTIPSVIAHWQNKNILVEWKGQQEKNLLKYEVEKSTDGKQFNKVYTANVIPNGDTLHTYRWLDESAAAGDNFYRLKTVDLNGNSKFSSIAIVETANSNATLDIYPNPVVQNNIHLQLNNQPFGKYQVSLLNNSGQLMYNSTLMINTATVSATFKINKNLIKGVYQLVIKNNGASVQSKKVFIQ